MSRKKSFVGDLTTEEQLTLEQGYACGASADFRLRCHMLLLSHKGYEVKQITAILDVCPQTVYSTMKGWQQLGLAALIRRKGQGRKAKLQVDNALQVQAVQQAVKAHAQSSRHILEELYAQLQIGPMSKRSLRRFLKKVVLDGSVSAGG